MWNRPLWKLENFKKFNKNIASDSWEVYNKKIVRVSIYVPKEAFVWEIGILLLRELRWQLVRMLYKGKDGFKDLQRNIQTEKTASEEGVMAKIEKSF